MFNQQHLSIRTQYLISIVLILLVSAVSYYLTDYTGYRVVALVLLMTVSVLAMLFRIFPVLLAALLSAIIWNYFFIPPRFTFHIDHAEDALMFLLYFIIALINAVLTFKIRQAENKARDKEEKEKTIRLYNTLLNSLSHELRTPISTILGSVDTLKDNRDKLSEKHQAELLTEIDKAGIRLNRQVENLLNMSRLETGLLKPKLEWCDLNELIHRVIRKYENPDTCTLRFGPDEMLPLVKIDGGLMEAVLDNLVQNAIQYNPGHAIIDISVRYDNNACLITVSDNGQGFPENEIPRVFDKFYRLPDSKTGGSGLGLSIVKGFVEAQLGKVSLENKKEGGAIFTLEIPAEASFIKNLKNE